LPAFGFCFTFSSSFFSSPSSSFDSPFSFFAAAFSFASYYFLNKFYNSIFFASSSSTSSNIGLSLGFFASAFLGY
jgi:hypothetical protein